MIAEFQVFEGDEFYAEASGPRKEALAEAMNYASQCKGPVRVEEIVRHLVYSTINN